jgi:hypothetical protein
MTDAQVESIPGNLRDGFSHIRTGTFCHANEVNAERVNNLQLRTKWFYTADGPIYFTVGKQAKLALTRESENLVLRNIDDAFPSLVHDKNFRPQSAEAEQSIHAEGTDVFDIKKLKLEKRNHEHGYVEISTAAYDNLNEEQLRLAERVFGTGPDFMASMCMLKEDGIYNTRIYILRSSYVRRETSGRKGPIARASWLNSLYAVSDFHGSGHRVADRAHVLGVPTAAFRRLRPVPVQSMDITAPSSEDVLKYAIPYVAEVNQPEFKEGLQKLSKHNSWMGLKNFQK